MLLQLLNIAVIALYHFYLICPILLLHFHVPIRLIALLDSDVRFGSMYPNFSRTTDEHDTDTIVRQCNLGNLWDKIYFCSVESEENLCDLSTLEGYYKVI